MFERRLKVLLGLPAVCGLMLIGRLYQLQVLRGDEYVRLAEAALVAPKQYLPPLRGRILDRFGRVLVSDEPAHDVTVHYGVLSMDPSYLLRVADRVRKQEPRWQGATRTALLDEVRRRVATMWQTFAEVAGLSMHELADRRDDVCGSIERLRRHIWRARREVGAEQPFDRLRLREENLFHPVLRDVSPEVRTRIEIALSDLPFVRVEPSVRRVWADDTESLCHVLGRLNQASPEKIKNDPLQNDELGCYRAGDLVGVSGIEWLGEDMLRGKRGFEERHLSGALLDDAPPIDGLDVQLTIDLDLQDHVADILRAAVREHPPSTGASCVIIDVESREVLALVSVPTFSRNQLRTDFAMLRDDTVHLPLLFRAVQAQYQPGSIMKPVALLAGLAYGVVDPAETITCNGSLFPGSEKWHCWTHWRSMPGHGPLTAEDALKNSCNVYFYTIGQRTNAERLTRFYRDFVRGPGAGDGNASAAGIGLLEERAGLLPTRDWMRKQRHRSFRPADGRNYAIGQGELLMTPLQAANMMATLADGAWRQPTLIANDCRRRDRMTVPGVSRQAFELARRGMYRVVNEQGGTAYNYARLDGLDICGKTGSAQCVARIVQRRYTFESDEADASEQPSVVAATVEAARETLGLRLDARCVRKEVVERYPAPEGDAKTPTHAWFAGFAPAGDPKIALALVLEYGGSGGQTAGPVARSIFEALMNSPRPYLRATALSAQEMVDAAGPHGASSFRGVTDVSP